MSRAAWAIGAAVLGVILLSGTARAAIEYICPVDGLEFPSQDELEAHMLAEHPGVRVPIAVKWD